MRGRGGLRLLSTSTSALYILSEMARRLIFAIADPDRLDLDPDLLDLGTGNTTLDRENIIHNIDS